MADILKVELEDSDGNIYYLKTDSKSVYFEDGKSLEEKFGDVVMKSGESSNTTAKFSQASSRSNLTSGEKLSSLFGKIMKWFADLKSHAFSDLVNNASTDDSTKAVAASVAKSLQDQISSLDANTTKHGGQFLAGQGATGGYSFLNDGGHDTGIYSDADGDLYFKQNNVVHRFSSPNADETITSQKTVTGSVRVVNCPAIDGNSWGGWPLYVQATDENAVRNGACAGIAFHNPGACAGVLFLQNGQLRFCNNGGQFYTINMTKS